jgi:hypothetical protein
MRSWARARGLSSRPARPGARIVSKRTDPSGQSRRCGCSSGAHRPLVARPCVDRNHPRMHPSSSSSSSSSTRMIQDVHRQRPHLQHRNSIPWVRFRLWRCVVGAHKDNKIGEPMKMCQIFTEVCTLIISHVLAPIVPIPRRKDFIFLQTQNKALYRQGLSR